MHNEDKTNTTNRIPKARANKNQPLPEIREPNSNSLENNFIFIRKQDI